MERDFRRLATTRGRGLVIFLFSPEIERKMKRCAPTGSLNRRAVCHGTFNLLLVSLWINICRFLRLEICINGENSSSCTLNALHRKLCLDFNWSPPAFVICSYLLDIHSFIGWLVFESPPTPWLQPKSSDRWPAIGRPLRTSPIEYWLPLHR